ncbi:MAG: Wadjet anti-phage system protein JetD domain-containing protein [Bacillota bacterium]
MKCNEMYNSELFYIKLKNEIYIYQGKYIFLGRLLSAIEGDNYDMPAYLQSPEGRDAFHDAVMKLVSEKLISPVGKKPITTHGLHLKYRINRKAEKKDDELARQIIKSIEPPAKLDYYLKNPQDFVKDRVIIEIISSFLRQKNNDIVTANERSYQLFGNEKFIKGDGKNRSHGETVLKRLGLGFSNIRCEDTIEPFFSFQNKDFHSKVSRNVYIIENRDTFWSFKRNIMDCSSIVKADMLVYGEGKKIISSFKFVDEYDVDPQRDIFFYFGDLDAEGINIYCELLDQYPQYRILPFCEGYQAVFEIGQRREPVKIPKQQKVNIENIERFISAFDQSWAIKLKKLLEGGFYIPQEALSAVEMKERFGSTQND